MGEPKFALTCCYWFMASSLNFLISNLFIHKSWIIKNVKFTNYFYKFSFVWPQNIQNFTITSVFWKKNKKNSLSFILGCLLYMPAIFFSLFWNVLLYSLLHTPHPPCLAKGGRGATSTQSTVNSWEARYLPSPSVEEFSVLCLHTAVVHCPQPANPFDCIRRRSCLYRQPEHIEIPQDYWRGK